MNKDKKPLDVIDGAKPDSETYEKKPPTPHRKNKKNLGGAESFEIVISRDGDSVGLFIYDAGWPHGARGWNISDELKTALIKELRESYDRDVDEKINVALAMLQGVKYEDPKPSMKDDPF